MTKTPWLLTFALFGVFTGSAEAVPAVTGLSPQSGTTEGGTVVTISGSGLSAATTVKWGTTAGTILSKSASQIVAVSPSVAVGGTSIRVTDASGTSPDVPNDNYTFNAVASGDLYFAPTYNAATTTVAQPSATLGAWRVEQEADDDRVQIVTGASVPAGSNPAAKPYGALKISNLYGDETPLTGSDPHPRAEASTQYRTYGNGDTAWIDYWLFVPTSTSLINGGSSYSTIFQWKGGTGSPVVGLEIDPTDEHLKITSNQFGFDQSLGSLTHNKWTRITIGVTFGDATNGRVKWSVDGAAVQSITKQTIGTGTTNTAVYPKQGLYQSQDDQFQPDRILYASPIRIASTQARAQQR